MLFSLLTFGVLLNQTNPPADVAKLVVPKLALPETVPVAPPASPAAPQPRPPQGPERMPVRLWNLPPAELSKLPVIIPDDLRPVPWKRPAADQPPLASERRPTSPTETTLPSSPRAYVILPDPQAIPALARMSPPAEPKLTLKDDPTYDRAHAYITSPLAVPAHVAPAVQRLGVADPFEAQRIAAWTNSPADNDPPAASLERPARPKLPPATAEK